MDFPNTVANAAGSRIGIWMPADVDERLAESAEALAIAGSALPMILPRALLFGLFALAVTAVHFDTRLLVVGAVVVTSSWLVLGLGIAFLAARYFQNFLIGVDAGDPLTYAAVTVAVITAVYFACYLPSRRAATIDPVEALRAE